MANSKNTKQHRDEKKSGDLSELQNNYSFEGEDDFESKSAHPEFTSKQSSSKDAQEAKNQTSAYALKINKPYGTDTNSKNKSKEDNDDYSYTSQLGNDQRDYSRESFKSNDPYQFSGRTHQLSYDQQFRYQQPHYQQPPDNGYTQYQGYDNQGGNTNQGPAFLNPYPNQAPFSQNRPFENNQQFYQQRYQQPYNQGSFPNQNFRQQNYNQGFGYQQPFGQQNSNQQFQPQGFNQSNPYDNRYENQQTVNRGYENRNYNDQSNRFRSSFNTQGFGNSIYRHENYQPDPMGSGYAGSTFGGQGPGEFRSNEFFNEQQNYDNTDFRFRQELKNPSRGFNRNYRQDERERNNYQHDEDVYTRGFKGFANANFEDPFNGFHSPYGNEREEQYGYEREYSKGRPFNERRDFDNPGSGFQNFQQAKSRRRRNRNNNY